jgi:hypothetical protein
VSSRLRRVELTVLATDLLVQAGSGAEQDPSSDMLIW